MSTQASCDAADVCTLADAAILLAMTVLPLVNQAVLAGEFAPERSAFAHPPAGIITWLCLHCVAAFGSLQSGGSSSSSDAPLLWMAAELAAPLNAQLLELFGPSGPGQPGELENPDLVLGTVHRLAQEHWRHIDFLQVGLTGVQLHSKQLSNSV